MRRPARSKMRRFLLLCGFLSAGIAPGAAAYTRPTTQPPTSADLLQCGGKASSLAVFVLNLTPYEIVATGRDTLDDQLDKNRKTKKSFMFAPVGVPSSLPPLTGSWTPDPENSTCKVFTPGTNNSVHPYSMVFSFDDRGGVVKEGYFTLSLKKVLQDGCHPATTDDVDIGFFFTRNDPKKKLVSEVIREISSAITVFVDTVGMIIDPENPIAWYDEFVAASELKDSSFELVNSEDTGGKKMYFAAYPWPDRNSPADMSASQPGVITSCTKCAPGETSDGVDAGWNAAMSGPFAGGFVVTTHLLRGHDPTSALSSPHELNAPVAFVVIWTNELYEAARAAMPDSALEKHENGRKLRSHLGHRDPHRFFALAHLFGSLDAAQLQTYRAAYNSLRARHQLTNEQKVLLARLALAFEQGRTSLADLPGHEGPDHERPIHEHPAHERPTHDGLPEVDRDHG